MRFVLLVIAVIVSCFAASTEAGSRIITVPLSSIVTKLDGRVAFGSSGVASENVTRVKDRRHADSCGPHFQAQLDCATVQFAGFGACDQPASAEQEMTDCGRVKVTRIKFASGNEVELRKRDGKVEVDYDRK